MRTFQTRRILLTHEWMQLNPSEILELASYARELSRVHTVVIATELGNVSALKEELARRDTVEINQIEVIGFRTGWAIRLFKHVFSNWYALLSNLWLVIQLRSNRLDFDLIEFRSMSRTPLPHFLWRLDMPVMWTKFHGLDRGRTNGLEVFFEGATYWRYRLSKAVWSLRFLIDPFLLYALHQTDHVVFRQGTSLHPLIVDANSCSEATDYQWTSKSHSISNCDPSKSLDFVCSIDYDVPSGVSIVLKAFSQMVKSSSPSRRSLLNLILINRAAREPRVTSLIDVLG